MMYKIRATALFKRDLKRAKKRGCDLPLLMQIIDTLAAGEALAPAHRDHALTGNYIGCRECHITPDWLLIYQYEEDTLILFLSRTGSHSDLF